MRWVRSIMLKLRAAVLRSRVEREMDIELAEHLERETEELIARGMPPDDAARFAKATMGHMDQIKEECRDSRGTVNWEQFKQDICFAVRLLVKHRIFSGTALATMALGIGSTTAVFSLIDAVLIRALPFVAPDRLFHAQDVQMAGPFDVLRANSRLADYAGYLSVRDFTLIGREAPERLKGCEVSANFFRVLGIEPLLGHGFADGEDRSASSRLAILSYDFWRQRFGARSDVVGKQLTLDERSYEIIGVMPPGFRYPAAAVNFWVPMRVDPGAVGPYWGMSGVTAFARLRPHVTPEAANSELRAWIPRIRTMFPWRMPDAWGTGARLIGLQDHSVARHKVRTLLLLGVAALVLLIAIVNVANLMLGQAAARDRELALRASLGATPGRLARQVFTEAVVLALSGGVLGTLLAVVELPLLKQLLPPDTPRLAEVAIDARVLAFSAAMSIGSGLLFGMAPAWGARRQRSLAGAADGRSTLSAAGLRTDAALVMAEVAFATILVVGAGLMLRSLWTMLQIELGFQTESTVTAELSPNRDSAASLEKTLALYEQVRLKLAAHPGVTHVAATNVLPLVPAMSGLSAAIEDHPRAPQEPQHVLWSILVTPEYLDTLDIRLLQGRGFTAADRQGSERVALISKATALRFWPDRSAIGRRLRPVFSNEWRTIVGVVDDVKHFGISGPPGWVNGEVYFPIAQAYFTPRTISLIARLDNGSAGFARGLPQMINEVCANCAVSKIARMEAVVTGAVQTPRSIARLVGGFALLALAMAAAGIYGVVNHGVVRRTRELGVRLALGASRARVAWLIMGSSLRYVLLGAVVGLSASLMLTRWIRTLVYGITEHDPVAFTIAPAVLIAVAILANLLPVCRAVTIDPAKSLREG